MAQQLDSPVSLPCCFICCAGQLYTQVETIRRRTYLGAGQLIHGTLELSIASLADPIS